MIRVFSIIRTGSGVCNRDLYFRFAFRKSDYSVSCSGSRESASEIRYWAANNASTNQVDVLPVNPIFILVFGLDSVISGAVL